MPEEIKAHITGIVFQVITKPGERVAAGDPVIVLESMKMEIPVEAPRAGAVKEIRSTRGRPSRRATSSPCWSREGSMSVEMIRGLYDYHRWANRRLFEVATALGEELTSRDVGKQSATRPSGEFGHLYGRIDLAVAVDGRLL